MAEAKQDKPGYELTAGERAVMGSLSQEVVRRKARICGLLEDLETARSEAKTAQDAFSGAVTLLAQTHGLGGTARITPDLARIAVEG